MSDTETKRLYYSLFSKANELVSHDLQALREYAEQAERRAPSSSPVSRSSRTSKSEAKPALKKKARG